MEVQERQCRKCLKVFPATNENFVMARKRRVDAGMWSCRACDKSIGARKGRGRFGLLRDGEGRAFDYYLRYKYGVTADWYDEQFARQGGTCAVCKNPPKKNRLSVDHDHETRKVRGLLCMNCNLAIERVKEMHEYLRKYSA